MSNEIATADLTELDVPSSGAAWAEIGRFALSFNGYEHQGSFEKCAEIANRWRDAYRGEGPLPDSLTELRTCLFFEQRRWRHFGLDPSEEGTDYVHAVVERIRERVRSREID